MSQPIYFTCDLMIEDSDERVFEWVLFIKADTIAEAVSLAELHINERRLSTRVDYLCLQRFAEFRLPRRTVACLYLFLTARSFRVRSRRGWLG